MVTGRLAERESPVRRAVQPHVESLHDLARDEFEAAYLRQRDRVHEVGAPPAGAGRMAEAGCGGVGFVHGSVV